MKIILVTGIPEVDRSTMIEVAMKRLNIPKEDLDHVDFDSISTVMHSILTGKDLTMHQINEMIKQMNDAFEKSVIKKMKTCSGVLMVNCSLTLSTEHGIFPVLNREFFETFSPELILLAEKKPLDITKKENEMKRLEKHQDINEAYSFSYSAYSHAAVDRIMIRKGKLDDAVRQLVASTKSIIKG